MIKLGVGLVISDKAERMLLCMYCIRTWLRTALAKGVLLPFFSVLAGVFRLLAGPCRKWPRCCFSVLARLPSPVVPFDTSLYL